MFPQFSAFIIFTKIAFIMQELQAWNVHLGFGYFNKNHQKEQRGETCYLLHMGQRSSDGSWAELQETAPSQEQAEFYAHRQREGLSYWGSSRLIRQMGAGYAAWLQEQITSIGAAENLLGSRRCLQPFVY